jgi:hypothetical protein
MEDAEKPKHLEAKVFLLCAQNKNDHLVLSKGVIHVTQVLGSNTFLWKVLT